MQIDLDGIDHKILNFLQTDGRMTNADLAERVHLSPSACLRRVQRLEQAGVIDGYVMLLNPEAVGLSDNIFVEISLSSQSEEILDAFETAVRNCADIMECYLMSGDADYMVRVAAQNTRDYERIHKQYLSRFPGVARIRSNFALRTVCKRTAIKM